MKKVYYWLYGWAVTLRIKFFQPELYRYLTAEFNPFDFIEVDEPGPPCE